MTSVESFLSEHGISYKDSGSELILETCPECNKQYHCYVNRYSGLFDCKRCGASGNFFTLKQKLGVIVNVKEPEQPKNAVSTGLDVTVQRRAIDYHNALIGNPEKLQELVEWWGISEETLRKYYIGYCTDYGKEWISIPTIQDGIVMNIKYRSWKGYEKEFRREKGGISVLYNAENIPTMGKVVLVAEGERDALTLIDKGITAVLGNSGGAATFKPEWIKLLDKFERIYICFDMDSAGNSGARKLMKKLGPDRCYNVILPTPGSDINDFFIKEGHSLEEFKRILKSAKPFDIPGVISVQDAYSRLYQRFVEGKDTPTVTTPWSKVNAMLNGGFFDGQLVTIAGQAKSLKTHLSYLIAEYNAEKGVPVFIYELEMDPAELAKRNITRLMQVPYKMIDPLDILMTKMKHRDLPIYIGEPSGSVDHKQLIETVKAVYQRFGIGFVVIDHAHLLVRSETHMTEKVSIMVKELAFMAKELEIPVLLLAQPNKAKDPRQRDTYSNIGWSNAFATDSDVILIVHRNRAEQLDPKGKELTIIQERMDEFTPDTMSFSPIATLYVDASRTSAGGATRLWCDPLYFTVDEIDSGVVDKRELESMKKNAYYIDTECAFEV